MKRHMAGGLEREGGDLEEGEKQVKGVGGGGGKEGGGRGEREYSDCGGSQNDE